MTTQPQQPDGPAYYATERTFQCGPAWGPSADPDAFDAMIQWVRDHGIDPAAVLLSHPLIRKDDSITYTAPDEGLPFVTCTHPVEGGPAPWPEVIEVSR